MPAKSDSQRKAAGRELGMRRSGKAIKEKAKRPFAGASEPELREFAAKDKKAKGKSKSSVGHYMGRPGWER